MCREKQPSKEDPTNLRGSDFGVHSLLLHVDTATAWIREGAHPLVASNTTLAHQSRAMHPH